MWLLKTLAYVRCLFFEDGEKDEPSSVKKRKLNPDEQPKKKKQWWIGQRLMNLSIKVVKVLIWLMFDVNVKSINENVSSGNLLIATQLFKHVVVNTVFLFIKTLEVCHILFLFKTDSCDTMNLNIQSINLLAFKN